MGFCASTEHRKNLRLWAEYLERYHYLGHRMPVRGQPALLRAFAPLPGARVGVPVMVLTGLEDRGAGPLDRVESSTACAESSLHAQPLRAQRIVYQLRRKYCLRCRKLVQAQAPGRAAQMPGKQSAAHPGWRAVKWDGSFST